MLLKSYFRCLTVPNTTLVEIFARKVELNHSDANRLQVWSLHPGPPRLVRAISWRKHDYKKNGCTKCLMQVSILSMHAKFYTVMFYFTWNVYIVLASTVCNNLQYKSSVIHHKIIEILSSTAWSKLRTGGATLQWLTQMRVLKIGWAQTEYRLPNYQSLT